MSPAECGAYIRLLCVAWDEEPLGTLPDDDSALAEISGLRESEWATHKLKVMAPFVLIGGRWHQKRLISEGEKAHFKHVKRVEAGRIGGLTRSSNAQAMLKQCSTNQNQNQNHKEKDTSYPKRKKFTKPSEEELQTYFRNKGFKDIDAKAFWDFHEARGWQMSRGVPMKDWEAAARMWMRNSKRFAGTNGQHKQKRDDRLL